MKDIGDHCQAHVLKMRTCLVRGHGGILEGDRSGTMDMEFMGRRDRDREEKAKVERRGSFADT
jgi:hypothetical protein